MGVSQTMYCEAFEYGLVGKIVKHLNRSMGAPSVVVPDPFQFLSGMSVGMRGMRSMRSGHQRFS